MRMDGKRIQPTLGKNLALVLVLALTFYINFHNFVAGRMLLFVVVFFGSMVAMYGIMTFGEARPRRKNGSG